MSHHRRAVAQQLRALGVALLLCFASVLSYAADDAIVTITPRPSHPDRLSHGPAPIRFDVNLVLIPVYVTDPYDRPIRGLHKEDFRLFEDSTQQQISGFFSDDSPISVGLLFDSSNSMRLKMDQSRKAVRQFLALSGPEDEFFLLSFYDRPEMLTGFTKNISDVESALPSIQPHGWTSLYDAIYLGINHMKRASHSRKVLLILSDGNDNDSRYTKRELTEMVKEADVRIFAISIMDRSRTLEELSEETGGRAYRVRKLEELPDLAATISEELHSEYVLGYFPTATQRDGKYRHITVQLSTPEPGQSVHATWRHGYYGPPE